MRDCRNDIGWYPYRQGKFARAGPWFERATTIKDFAPIPQERESALAVENMTLVYVALNTAKEAGEATVNHIARSGRVSWPERRVLLKLNINADAPYMSGHAVGRFDCLARGVRSG